MTALRLVFFASLLALASTRAVFSGSGLEIAGDVLYGNAYVGSHDQGFSLTDSPYVFFDANPTDSPSACAMASGAVAVVHVPDSAQWSWQPEEDLAVALEGCGAVALVRLREAVSKRSLGMSYHAWTHDCCKDSADKVSIPLLVAHVGLRDAFTAAPNGTASLTIDPNQWTTGLWDTAWFFLLGRLLLVTANVVVTAQAARALRRIHTNATAKKSRGPLGREVNQRMALGSCFVAVGAVLRIVYLALGPLFCNGSLSQEGHMFFINISMPIQGMTVVLIIALFNRLIRFKDQRGLRRDHKKRVFLITLGIIGFLLEFATSYMRATKKDFALMVMISTATALVVILGSSALFLNTGIRFLRRIRASEVAHHQTSKKDFSPSVLRKRKMRVRFATYILYSVGGMFAQLVIAAVFLIHSDPTPPAFGLTWISYYYATTFTALFHVLAFTPVAKTEQQQQRSGAESARLQRARDSVLANNRSMEDVEQPAVNRLSTQTESDEELEDYGAAEEPLLGHMFRKRSMGALFSPRQRRSQKVEARLVLSASEPHPDTLAVPNSGDPASSLEKKPSRPTLKTMGSGLAAALKRVGSRGAGGEEEEERSRLCPKSTPLPHASLPGEPTAMEPPNKFGRNKTMER